MVTSLDELIAPVSRADFFGRYFEKDVLYVANQTQKAVDGILSRDDFESILWQQEHALRSIVRLARNGEVVTRLNGCNGRPPAKWLVERYHQGWTLIIDEVQKVWPPVARLLQGLGAEFGCDFYSSAYLTPAGSLGVVPHYDCFDIFVIQLDGVKKWRFFEQAFELPQLAGHTYRLDLDHLGSPTHELSLRPGEVLYFPRGMPHHTRTEEDASLSLTIAMTSPHRRVDLLKRLLDAAAEVDVVLRRSAPPNQERAVTQQDVQEALLAFADQLRDPALLDRTLRQARREYLASLRGTPGSAFALDDLQLHDVVEKPAGVPCFLEHDAASDTLSLYFPQGAVEKLPRKLEAVLQFVARATEPFAVVDLPGDFSAETRLTLVRRFLKEGLLRRIDASSPCVAADVHYSEKNKKTVV